MNSILLDTNLQIFNLLTEMVPKERQLSLYKKWRYWDKTGHMTRCLICNQEIWSAYKMYPPDHHNNAFVSQLNKHILTHIPKNLISFI